MKSRIAIVLVMLMSVVFFAGCATTGGDAALDPSLVRTDDLNFWEECGWADMTQAEQELWNVLGWDEASWEGEAKKPESEDKYWGGLSPEEQAAATTLGYTQATWDEE